MVTIASKRKKPVLSHEGYMYRFDRRSVDDSS